MKIDFIEIVYTMWLANVVMVKKTNGKRRMYTNYTNLNNTCPKDTYPLPSIDRLVDNTVGYELLNFLYAYSPKEDKNAFMTKGSKTMPFPKNASATYQCLMDKVFKDLIDNTMEVYVNENVVKSTRVEDHPVHLERVFSKFRAHNMRLNLKKMIFGSRRKKISKGHDNTTGNEVNPKKSAKSYSSRGIRLTLKKSNTLTGSLLFF